MSLRKTRQEQGVALIEFALTLGILLVIFAAAGTYLMSSSRKRAAASMATATRDIPCIDPSKSDLYPYSATEGLVWDSSECE